MPEGRHDRIGKLLEGRTGKGRCGLELQVRAGENSGAYLQFLFLFLWKAFIEG